jgi:hypothetical protein
MILPISASQVVRVTGLSYLAQLVIILLHDLLTASLTILGFLVAQVSGLGWVGLGTTGCPALLGLLHMAGLGYSVLVLYPKDRKCVWGVNMVAFM